MDIISYNKEEIDSKLQTWQLKQGFDKNPTLTRYISKLSDQYNKYKLSYKFPTKYKGKNDFEKQQNSKYIIYFRV